MPFSQHFFSPCSIYLHLIFYVFNMTFWRHSLRLVKMGNQVWREILCSLTLSTIFLINYLYLIFKISMIQQRNKYIKKNIYFSQEKSVNINKTVKCKYSVARSLNGVFERTQTSRQKQLENFLTSAKNSTYNLLFFLINTDQSIQTKNGVTDSHNKDLIFF